MNLLDGNNVFSSVLVGFYDWDLGYITIIEDSVKFKEGRVVARCKEYPEKEVVFQTMTRPIWRNGTEYVFHYLKGNNPGCALFWLFREMWHETLEDRYGSKDWLTVYELVCDTKAEKYYRPVSLKDVIQNGREHYHEIKNFDELWNKLLPNKYKDRKRPIIPGNNRPTIDIIRRYAEIKAAKYLLAQ